MNDARKLKGKKRPSSKIQALKGRGHRSPSAQPAEGGRIPSGRETMATRPIDDSVRESDVKYRTVFENTGTAMIIFEDDGTISLANAEAERISGYSRPEIEGRKKWTDFIPAEDVERMLALQRLRRSQPDVAPRTYEVDLVPKSGPVKRISLTVATIPGTARSIASIRDLTDLERASRELQESERKYRELVQNANSIILRWNRSGEITFLNEFGQRFFGYTEEELLGRHVVGTIVPASESTGRDLSPLMSEILAHPEAFEKNTNENMRRNGERVWIAWTNKIVTDEAGRVKEILSIGSDITEQKRAQAELDTYRLHLEDLVAERTSDLRARTDDLERSRAALQALLEDMDRAKKEIEAANIRLRELDRLKSLFIASMSHELRTPLNSIIGFTGMTLQGLSGELNEEQKDNLSRVLQSARHLLALITDVIDISKIEAGRIDSVLEVVPLGEVVEEAVASVRPQLEDKGLTLTADLPAGVDLRTDRRRLLQCLINLLSNGIKFTERGGLALRVEASGAEVDISVTDTGIGIPQKDLGRLFDAFERLDSPLRVKAGGTGLGLYLTKKLATEVLQGRVSVRSVEGEGSTFTLTVPRAADAPRNRDPEGGGR